jgi:hypothetical protein
MAAAGSDPAVWVAVAGASPCACGLVVGSTARVVPAAALAGVAATALVLAVEGRESGLPLEVRAYWAPAVVEELPRAEPSPAATPAPTPPPLTPPRFVRRSYAALEAGRFEQAWARLGPAVQARSPSFEA